MSSKTEYAVKVKESRQLALSEIKEILDNGDVKDQFKDRSGNYYSEEKFLVVWIGNYQGIPCEFGLDKTDEAYTAFSGYRCVYTTRSLFHEKQLAGYRSIERGLLEVGLKLCPNRKAKEAFHKKYCIPYNERLKVKS